MAGHDGVTQRLCPAAAGLFESPRQGALDLGLGFHGIGRQVLVAA